MGLNILLADDDKDDRFFFNMAVSELDPRSTLATVPNGEQLMLKLKETVAILPDIVFLDLNMPRKNGFVCLDEIRKDPVLKQLFVAIYTTSSSPKDVADALEKGANLFVKKPNGYDDLKVIVAKVLTLDLNQFPAYSTTSDNFILFPQECKW